jgi:hypothetical protein
MGATESLPEKIARLEERIRASDKALEVANASMQERLAGMNEFRAQLKDQASRFANRDEVDLKLDPIVKDIRELREFKSLLTGKADQHSVNMALVTSIVGIVVAITSLIINIFK